MAGQERWKKLNALYAEIKDLFCVGPGIEEFSRSPADYGRAQKSFADLFQSFNENLGSSQGTGLRGGISHCDHQRGDTDENGAFMRTLTKGTFKGYWPPYKELFTPNRMAVKMTRTMTFPMRCEQLSTTIDTADIDTDYELRFEKYLKIFYQDRGLIHRRNGLHKTFATLAGRAEPIYFPAHDIQSGAVVPQPGKDLAGVHCRYIAQKQNDQIHKVAGVFGLDEKKAAGIRCVQTSPKPTLTSLAVLMT